MRTWHQVLAIVWIWCEYDVQLYQTPLIFILAVELLALKIRQNERIRGIIIPNAEPGNELKIQQFADDITLMVSSSEDFNVALNTVDAASTFSGLNLNKSKCEGLWLGKQPAEGLPKVIKWCPPGETIEILGINFSATTSATNLKNNWEAKLSQMVDTIKQWEKRNLSIMGKILLAKTFLLSKCVYIMQGISLPAEVLNKIDQIMYKFIWKRQFTDKKAFEKVKRAVVNADIESVDWRWSVQKTCKKFSK